jgi:sugar/nucleoside kinase (ribokinase family)
VVIDPTGAGDAFAAGFLDARIAGATIVDAAQRGVDWAARACRHLGARGWLDAEPPETH